MREYSKLKRYLSSVQSVTPDFYLSKTLYYICKTQYQEAIANLKLVEDSHFELIKDLLLIDLDYELAKDRGARNYKKYLQDYQILMDKYANNEILRNVIALRTRYIRYNY